MPRLRSFVQGRREHGMRMVNAAPAISGDVRRTDRVDTDDLSVVLKDVRCQLSTRKVWDMPSVGPVTPGGWVRTRRRLSKRSVSHLESSISRYRWFEFSRSGSECLSFRDSLLHCVKNAYLGGIRQPQAPGALLSSGSSASFANLYRILNTLRQALTAEIFCSRAPPGWREMLRK